MASVHLGRVRGAAGFSRTVAIKRLHPQFASDPLFRDTLLDEARLVARIRHPHVVPVLDVIDEEGMTLVVMEYIDGLAASTLLEACRASYRCVPIAVAVAIVHEVLQGLHAAHGAVAEDGTALGLVHRDVSPQNILVSAGGVALITDFGIAKAAGRSRTTKTGEIKGKLAYLAPEQLLAAQATPVSDVYAAGLVLWELIAGRRVFDGTNDAQVYAQVVQQRIPSLRGMAPEVPDDLDAIVRRALSREPADRFASAREMAAALSAAVQPATRTEVSEWVESTAGVMLAERAAWLAELEPSTSTEHHATRPKQRSTSRGAMALGALVVCAALVWIATKALAPAGAERAEHPSPAASALPEPAASVAPTARATVTAAAIDASAGESATAQPPRPRAPRPATRPCRKLGADGIWRIEECPVR
jgi:serine/threonine-protein kinase